MLSLIIYIYIYFNNIDAQWFKSAAPMRPALKEAMLVLFPVPHRKHMKFMCFKWSINRYLATAFVS